MRNAVVMTWALMVFSCAGRAQAQPEMRSPAQVTAAFEAELQGRAEAMFGSDLAARDALINGTPYAKSQAILQALQLPDPPRQQLIPGTVSAASLRHAVPKAAVKDFQRAHKLATSGKFLDAKLELEKALTLDPDFAEAQENLGAVYLKLGRPAEAEPHLRRAIELNRSSSGAHSNLSAVQLLAGDFDAAERSARRALDLSRGNDWARFVLGVTLLRNTSTYDEALQHLKQASRSVLPARQTLEALQVK